MMPGPDEKRAHFPDDPPTAPLVNRVLRSALERQRARAGRAEADAQRRLGLLRELEWVTDDGVPVCPVCGGLQLAPYEPPGYPVGHEPGCRLDAELRGGPA